MNNNRIADLAEKQKWDELLQALPTATEEEIKCNEGWDGMTALQYACSYNAPPHIVKALLECKGADVNGPFPDGQLPLVLACMYNHSPELIQLWLDYGADPNKAAVINFWGGTKAYQTPLIAAVQRGVSPAIIILLLQAGANQDYKGYNDKTAIEMARLNERQDLVDVLSNWQPCKSAKFLT
jgi:ankyrin repeat protein